MKAKKTAIFSVTAILMFLASPVFAETFEEAAEIFEEKFEEMVTLEIPEEINQNNRLFVTYKYGFTASWLTRIIYQTERSNFVLRDFLPGTYFTVELQNIPLITPEVRIAAYYPLSSTFNRMEQHPNTPLHIGADLFAGARMETGWNFIKVNGGLGLHMFFLTSDRWNYINLGLAAVVGIDFALSPGWTLLIDGFASFDNGNLGANQYMEPFNITYQYQTGIGVRYSGKKPNTSALFMPKNNPPEILYR